MRDILVGRKFLSIARRARSGPLRFGRDLSLPAIDHLRLHIVFAWSCSVCDHPHRVFMMIGMAVAGVRNSVINLRLKVDR